MTPTTLESVRDVAHLEALIAGSSDRPLLLYKHSRSCGTSHEALDELHAHLAEAPRDARYAIVTVQGQRDLSDAVARRFQLRHETPQAILVRDGQMVWSASHFRVTSASIAHAIDEASTAALTR